MHRRRCRSSECSTFALCTLVYVFTFESYTAAVGLQRHQWRASGDSERTLEQRVKYTWVVVCMCVACTFVLNAFVLAFVYTWSYTHVHVDEDNSALRPVQWREATHKKHRRLAWWYLAYLTKTLCMYVFGWTLAPVLRRHGQHAVFCGSVLRFFAERCVKR